MCRVRVAKYDINRHQRVLDIVGWLVCNVGILRLHFQYFPGASDNTMELS